MMGERNVITVTALNKYVKTLLERDPVLTDVRLRGEISNFVHHRSGHCYFSLKDSACSVKAVMFRGDAQGLRFVPQNGMCVVADCRISLFERDGSFQVYVEHMFPDGVGSIRLAFEQLKARLEKEGLFDPAHKKPLPALPQTVGVVTSATGAALQDIRNVLTRRYPMVKLLLAPVNVQGAEAAEEIAAAITRLDKSGLADVLVVARGGGSAEDLWVFNDERIARAAYNCKTPIVSAIGHEIDFTILDFAADVRAPTPSAAAELVVPDVQSLREKLAYFHQNIHYQLENRLFMCYNEWKKATVHPALTAAAQAGTRGEAQLKELTGALKNAAAAQLRQRTQALAACEQLAATLDPRAVLARGYAMLRQNGVPVPGKKLQPGETVTVETGELWIDCTVETLRRKDEA